VLAIAACGRCSRSLLRAPSRLGFLALAKARPRSRRKGTLTR
jgi:hypothetical protein